MSLLLAGLVCAGASGAMMVGRWLARRRDDDAARADGGARQPAGDVGDPTRTKEPEAHGETKEDAPSLEGFPCRLGDVVMRITGEEAWLAGGLVLAEDVPVAVLFVAPEAGHDTALYARPRPRPALMWLEPLDPGAVLVGGEPPTAVEHRGVRFDRVRRLPLRAERAGVGAPDVGDVVVVAEYASAGSERLLVLKGNAGVRAFRGHELEAAAYEVIASGTSTMDRARDARSAAPRRSSSRAEPAGLSPPGTAPRFPRPVTRRLPRGPSNLPRVRRGGPGWRAPGTLEGEPS